MAKKLVKYSVVDAFTDSPFKGNQAAVCLLEEDRDDEWLQSVAAEFNISETCYLTRIAESEARDSPNGLSVPRFRLRWFTPVAEVQLCGHATLAAAQTLFTSGKIDSDIIEFETLSGILTARKVPAKNKGSDGHEEQIGFFIELNFPADPNTDFNSVEDSLISKALGGVPVIDVKRTNTLDYLTVVVPSAKSVEDLWPDFDAIGKFPGKGTIVTGIAPPASGFDFYSRFFAPKFGINEPEKHPLPTPGLVSEPRLSQGVMTTGEASLPRIEDDDRNIPTLWAAVSKLEQKFEVSFELLNRNLQQVIAHIGAATPNQRRDAPPPPREREVTRTPPPVNRGPRPFRRPAELNDELEELGTGDATAPPPRPAPPELDFEEDFGPWVNRGTRKTSAAYTIFSSGSCYRECTL